MVLSAGYHWDTSDWAPVREDGAVGGLPNSRLGHMDPSYPVARLLVSQSDIAAFRSRLKTAVFLTACLFVVYVGSRRLRICGGFRAR